MEEPGRSECLETRKTRIVCISDTHCQTPKLPRGDVLIHAGDLTNQGSYSELKKTVDWLEKAEFEAKIVVAGNHDITLDPSFYEEHGSLWRWPQTQDPEACRQLLTASPSITYLENEAANIYLRAPGGPHTCFKVYGSPYSPKSHRWAFQYEAERAKKLWDGIPSDTDIVVTHTPPKGHCDQATKDDRSGCETLLGALYRVRPMLSICGHIHEARGVERMRWNDSGAEDGGVVEEVEKWKDPGIGNKQSLVNLTAAGGRSLDNGSRLTRQAVVLQQNRGLTLQDCDGGGQPGVPGSHGPMVFRRTQRPAYAGSSHSEAEEERATKNGLESAADHDQREDDDDCKSRRETAVINAAVLGPRLAGKGMQFNKPIVVDVALPVWSFENNVG
ncbi:unnamed protein product [Periconia digitata]|uniref:Calcineurin-like phosphoesterase domain-containing protein n=1 Tax=Periconia digitata TaxID=1303443 RepID=A0A9W4UD70_9PLEO|nr:unnamed protein product [Periconia digitata]